MAKPRVGGRGPHRSTSDPAFADTLATLVVSDTKAVLKHEEFAEEIGNDLILQFSQLGKRYGSMLNLTQMTEEELLALQNLLEMSVKLALPVVRQRDKEAQDAFTKGDDAYERVYRAVPQLVYREGTIEAYGESLHQRPDDLPGGVGDGDGAPD